MLAASSLEFTFLVPLLWFATAHLRVRRLLIVRFVADFTVKGMGRPGVAVTVTKWAHLSSAWKIKLTTSITLVPRLANTVAFLELVRSIRTIFTHSFVFVASTIRFLLLGFSTDASSGGTISILTIACVNGFCLLGSLLSGITWRSMSIVLRSLVGPSSPLVALTGFQ